MITTGSKFLLGVGLYGIVATLAYVLASDFERTGMVTLGTLVGGGAAAGLPHPGHPRRPGRHRGLPRRPPGRRRHHRSGARSCRPACSRSSAPSAWRCCSSAWPSTAGTRSSAPCCWSGSPIEWIVQAWSDRASDDGEYNRGLRHSMMHPHRVPGPRRHGGRARDLRLLAGDAHRQQERRRGDLHRWSAGLVLVVASLFAGLRRIGGDVLVGTLMVGGVIVLTAGVISVVQGERGFHESEGEGADTEKVADVASVAARFELTSGGLSPTGADRAPGRAGQHHVQQLPQWSAPPRPGGGRGPPTCAGQTYGRSPSRASRRFVEDGQTTFLTFKIHPARHLHVHDRGRGRHRPHRGHGRGRVRRDPAFVRGTGRGLLSTPCQTHDERPR